MIALALLWVPLVVNIVLGADELARSGAGLRVKIGLVVLLGGATAAQLASPWPLAGFLFQWALAFALAIRRRVRSVRTDAEENRFAVASSRGERARNMLDPMGG